MPIEYKIDFIGDASWRIDERLNGLHVYAYLLEGSRKALLVDTCQGLGDLRAEVRRLTGKPIEVLNTHGHLDHIGSNYQFDTVYIHRDDLPVAQEHGDAAYRLALLARVAREQGFEMEKGELECYAAIPQTKCFTALEDGHELDIGGRKLRVLHTPGHTPGSICLLEAEKRWLFTGDTVCEQGVLLSLPHSCSVRYFAASIKGLKARSGEFDTLHPGHHRAPIDNRFLDTYLACADGILDGSIKGTPGTAAGSSVQMGAYGGIAIAHRADNIR